MEQTMAAANEPSLIQSIYLSVKRLVQKYLPEAATLTLSKTLLKVLSKADPLNHNAYFWYRQDTEPKSNVGQHRGIVNNDNPSYDINAAAARDRSRHRTACLAAHLAPGDKYQIALTLHDTVAALEVREHSERVIQGKSPKFSGIIFKRIACSRVFFVVESDFCIVIPM